MKYTSILLACLFISFVTVVSGVYDWHNQYDLWEPQGYAAGWYQGDVLHKIDVGTQNFDPVENTVEVSLAVTADVPGAIAWTKIQTCEDLDGSGEIELAEWVDEGYAQIYTNLGGMTAAVIRSLTLETTFDGYRVVSRYADGSELEHYVLRPGLSWNGP